MNQAKIGTGFEEIEVVDNFMSHFDDIDAYFFLDEGHGETQVQLESMGKAVWGCKKAEELEYDRVMCKELMQDLGLPIGPWDSVTGIKKLRAYLEVNDNVFIKISHWRGYFETKFVKNYSCAKPFIDDLESKLGPMSEEAVFVLEQPLEDKFESAIDTWNIDGKLPSKMLYGVEVKNKAYLGRIFNYKQIPEHIRKFDTAIAPTLEEYGYRSFYDPESRNGKDKVSYMIDICVRAPSPPNELYQLQYTNLAQAMLDGANGICTDPESDDPWGAELIIKSDWADKHHQPVTFPKEFEKNVKLRNSIERDGKRYCLPQHEEICEIGAVVATGKTMEEAIEACKEIADNVEGCDIVIDCHCLDEAIDEIEKAKEYLAWPTKE
jgi:hypothetical protein